MMSNSCARSVGVGTDHSEKIALVGSDLPKSLGMRPCNDSQVLLPSRQSL